MTTAAKYGIRGAARLIFGILTGFVIVMLLCALFSAGLEALVPRMLPVMKWLGAAYILWLAWGTLTSPPPGKESGRPRESSFLSGFMLEFVNLKIMLYGITALSSFVLPAFSSPAVIAGFAVMLALTGSAANWTWALFGAAFQQFFSKHVLLLNVSMALLLAYCAFSIVL